jgi:hypothetical protein
LVCFERFGVMRLQLHCSLRRMTLLEWIGAKGVVSLGARRNMQVLSFAHLFCHALTFFQELLGLQRKPDAW